MANNVDRLSRNVHRIVERADIQIPPAPKFPAEAVTGPTISRLAAVARFNGDLQKWRNDRWSVDAPFVTEAELSRSVTKLSDEQALLTTRLNVGLQDLSELEARVTVLETSVTNIDARVTILESAVGTAIPHTILDATVHTDSVTQTVTRGALIYGNATLKWDLLTIGPPGTYVRSDGTDTAWSSVVATEITGILPVASGGTNAGSWTQGSVIFAGAGGTSLAEDNANLFWDNTNNRLGVGMNSPLFPLHVGVGLTTTSNNLVYFTDTRVAQGPLETVLEIRMDANPTSYSAASNYTGLDVNADSKAANTVGMGGLVGCNFKANHRGTGTADAVYGVKGAATKIGAGTITDARGMSSRIRNLNAVGTIVSGYNYYVETPTLTGAITNQYGLYLNNMGGAGATNIYGIYNAGQSGASTLNYFIYSVSGLSYFGSNVGIGIAVPTEILHLAHNIPVVRFDSLGAPAAVRNWSILNGQDVDGGLSFRVSAAKGGNPSLARLFIGSDGNVGIGTTAPATIFHVSHASSPTIKITDSDFGTGVTDGLDIQMSGAHAFLWNYENGRMGFATNNGERLTILPSGDVGIGTITPQTALSFPTASTGITLYNTADMVTNYERGIIAWSANKLQVGTQKGGTGGNRGVNFIAPAGQFNFGRTFGTSGAFEMNVEAALTGDNLNLISFRPSGAVTAGGFGTAWATSGFYWPTSGGSASYSWFGIYPQVAVSGTYSATDFSVLRISPELTGVVGITSVYLINAGTNSGTANQGTHTRLFTVDNSGNTRMEGGIVVGNMTTAAVDGTYYGFLNDGALSSASTMATLNHGSTGTPAAGFGTDILFQLESDSTANQDAGALRVAWTTATNANRTAAMYFRLVNNAAAISTQMVLSAAGGLSVGSGTLDTLPVGVINAVTGFRANNAAPSGEFLRGNGTNFVSSTIQLADLPPGSGVTFANPTALVSTAAVNGVATTAMRSDAAPAIDQGMGPTWTAGHTWDLGTSAPADDPLAAISLSATVLGAAGFRDSHAFALIGQSFDASPHSLSWRQWVNVTSNAGASSWVLQRNIDLGTYVTKLRVYDTGLVEVGPDGVGVTQLDTYGLAIVNATPAVSGAAGQQWSGPLRFEGQGWKTNATAGTMKTEFRQYIAPVQGAAAPTVYWVMEHSVNDVAYTEIMRADSTGFVRVLKDAIGDLAQNANSELGLKLVNTTLAIAGTQQQSPAFTQTGSGYHTTTGAGPETVSFRQQVVPIEGTSASAGYWRIDSKIGGGSYTATNMLMMHSNGGLVLGAFHPATSVPTGVFSVQVGFRIAGAAPTVGHFLRSNGTHFIDGVIGAGDIPLAAVTAHALLSATHSDTVATVVARGALVVGKNASPAWERLVVDTANRVLTNNGTDTAWGKVDLAATTNVTGVLAVVNGGTNSNLGSDQCVAFYNSASALLVFTDNQIRWEYTNYLLKLTDPSISNWTALRLSNNSGAPAAADTVRIAFGLTGGITKVDAVNLVAGKETDWVSPATVDTYFDIQTTLDDAASPTTGISIRSTGSIICGKDSTGTTRTDDFTYICTTNGAPTVAPTTFGSRVPITFDPNTDTFYIYRGGWKGVAVA